MNIRIPFGDELYGTWERGRDAVSRNFEALGAQMTTGWLAQHNNDNTHGVVTAERVTIRRSGRSLLGALADLDGPIKITDGTQGTDKILRSDAVGLGSWVTVPAVTPVPTGSMVMFGGTVAPVDWLLCNGAAVGRVPYATLFGVLGVAYGVGDGATTFNLPDLRQRVPMGLAAAGTGSTLGGTLGAIDHTHTGPSHDHTITHTHTGPSHVHGGTSHAHSITHDHSFSDTSGGNSTVVTTEDGGGSTHNVALDGHTHDVAGTTGGSSAANTGDGGDVDTVAGGTGNTGASSAASTGAAGTGASGTNNPPCQVVNFIIKT